MSDAYHILINIWICLKIIDSKESCCAFDSAQQRWSDAFQRRCQNPCRSTAYVSSPRLQSCCHTTILFCSPLRSKGITTIAISAALDLGMIRVMSVASQSKTTSPNKCPTDTLTAFASFASEMCQKPRDRNDVRVEKCSSASLCW